MREYFLKSMPVLRGSYHMLLPPNGVIVEIWPLLRLPPKAQVLPGPQLVGLADPADPLQNGAVGGEAHLLRDLLQGPTLASQIVN